MVQVELALHRNGKGVCRDNVQVRVKQRLFNLVGGLYCFNLKLGLGETASEGGMLQRESLETKQS